MDKNPITSQEITISTPTGRRVLVAIEPSNYASVRQGFEPESANASERLRLRDRDPNPVTVSPDGTWINHRQLYAIANGIVGKLKLPVLAVSIGDVMFFKAYRPDVAAVFRSVFSTYDDRDPWWNEMYRTSRFDPSTAKLRPLVSRF